MNFRTTVLLSKTLALCGSLLCTSVAAATDPPAATVAETGVSSTAENVYAAARPRLLQIRSLVAAAGRQSSIGSGFLVGADGLAVTNYHVVSQVALEPQTYRLEYTAADGSTGPVTLLAIDIANDLAVVQIAGHDLPAYGFDERALAGEVPKGERLYAMGDPLDLGFTIVEGTYNGPVARSYSERVHFSGAINPGMSGGPTVSAENRVVGVNVAKRLDGELVSFLVPARFAAALVERAREAGVPEGNAPAPKDLREEITRQLTARQEGLYKAVDRLGFRSAQFGPYAAPESLAPWFTCWAQTNADHVPKPRAALNATSCNADTRLFIASDFDTGFIQIAHSYFRSLDLNAFQFSEFVSQRSQLAWTGGWSRKWLTPQSCHEDFVTAGQEGARPPLRVFWCARGYRLFPGLYDVWVASVTQDKNDETLVSHLLVEGVSFSNGMALTRRFLESLTWMK